MARQERSMQIQASDPRDFENSARKDLSISHDDNDVRRKAADFCDSLPHA